MVGDCGCGWAATASIAAVTVTRPGRSLTTLALVAATLTVSGCGNMHAGAAAVVADRRISQAQLQQATSDITAYARAQDPNSSVDQRKVLLFMILEPDLVEIAGRAGIGVSVDNVRQELARFGVTKPSDGAVAAMRGLAALNSLGQANRQAELSSLLAKLRSEKIAVNPRYGKFDPATPGIVAVTPDWLVGGESATLPPGGDEAGDGTGDEAGNGTSRAPAPTSTP